MEHTQHLQVKEMSIVRDSGPFVPIRAYTTFEIHVDSRIRDSKIIG